MDDATADAVDAFVAARVPPAYRDLVARLRAVMRAGIAEAVGCDARSGAAA